MPSNIRTTLADLATDCPETSCAFQFLAKDSRYDVEKPYYFSGPLLEEQEGQRTNLVYTTHDGIKLRDIRNNVAKLRLDDHGFQLLPNPSQIDLTNPSDFELHQYLTEISMFVKETLDAEDIFCYSFRFRRNQDSNTTFSKDDSFRIGSRKNQDTPVLVPHTDQTIEGGPRRVRRHLTEEEAEKYLNGNWRVRIVNCWRPLFYSADERPLAMCDYHSIEASDLRSADRASREYVGEIYYLHHNVNQQWYWISGQTPGELLLFVNYDSEPRNGPPYMAHSAFINNAAEKHAKPRQSLEMALIVISKKEGMDNKDKS